MNIKNMFLGFITVAIVTTGVYATQADKKNEPYVLDKGFDTSLSFDYDITIWDVITNSPKLKECGCTDLQETLVVTVIKKEDGTVGVLGIPLGGMQWYMKEIVSHMEEDIFNNYGIVFPERISNRSATKLLPIIVLRINDIKTCEAVLEMLLKPATTTND